MIVFAWFHYVHNAKSKEKVCGYTFNINIRGRPPLTEVNVFCADVMVVNSINDQFGCRMSLSLGHDVLAM